jgi:hypothetical protein
VTINEYKLAQEWEDGRRIDGTGMELLKTESGFIFLGKF